MATIETNWEDIEAHLDCHGTDLSSDEIERYRMSVRGIVGTHGGPGWKLNEILRGFKSDVMLTFVISVNRYDLNDPESLERGDIIDTAWMVIRLFRTLAEQAAPLCTLKGE